MIFSTFFLKKVSKGGRFQVTNLADHLTIFCNSFNTTELYLQLQCEFECLKISALQK